MCAPAVYSQGGDYLLSCSHCVCLCLCVEAVSCRDGHHILYFVMLVFFRGLPVTTPGINNQESTQTETNRTQRFSKRTRGKPKHMFPTTVRVFSLKVFRVVVFLFVFPVYSDQEWTV